MRKHTPKNAVRVSGKMNEIDAGIVGKMYGKAALIAATSGEVIALASLIYAIRWW